MRSALTAYTRRCSSVIRRDQAPARACLRGSGFPTPWNGSRVTASTRSSTRRAVRRLVSTQYRRSWRNSGWKTATRLLGAPECGLPFFAKAEVSPELIDRLRLQLLPSGSPQCGDEPPGVLRRPEQVRRFHQALELVR